jgi:hypothetical protein
MNPTFEGWFNIGRMDRKANRPLVTTANLLGIDDERRRRYEQGWNFEDAVQKEIQSLQKAPDDKPKC